MKRGFVEVLERNVKRPLSEREIAAIGKVMAGVAPIRDRRKRKKLLRRAREKARLLELGLKAKK